jgi:hypothetical protein
MITCASHTDCCSSWCNPQTATCGFPPNATNCLTNASACAKDEDCCSANCNPLSGTCGPFACVADGGACDAGGECCDGLRCAASACKECLANGESCQVDLDCCSLICSHGTCSRT